MYSEQDAAQGALALWEERERQCAELLRLMMLAGHRPMVKAAYHAAIREAACARREGTRTRPASRRTHHAALNGASVRPYAERALDDIWFYLAPESGSIEIANRLIDTITDRLGEYVIVHCAENEVALNLRVVRGRRSLEALFGRS